MTVYDFLNNTFTDNFGIPDPNIPPIKIYDRPQSNKIEFYTPDMLPVAISVASENSVSTLATPSGLSRLFLLTFDDTNPPHAIIKYDPYYIRAIRG